MFAREVMIPHITSMQVTCVSNESLRMHAVELSHIYVHAHTYPPQTVVFINPYDTDLPAYLEEQKEKEDAAKKEKVLKRKRDEEDAEVRACVCACVYERDKKNLCMRV
jgi:hypothetical protein